MLPRTAKTKSKKTVPVAEAAIIGLVKFVWIGARCHNRSQNKASLVKFLNKNYSYNIIFRAYRRSILRRPIQNNKL